MIRAVVENGLIRPLEPLPPGWSDGREVIVEDSPSIGELEAWCRELESLDPAPDEPGDWDQMQRILNEADEQAKDQVRREASALSQLNLRVHDRALVRA